MKRSDFQIEKRELFCERDTRSGNQLSYHHHPMNGRKRGRKLKGERRTRNRITKWEEKARKRGTETGVMETLFIHNF